MQAMIAPPQRRTSCSAGSLPFDDKGPSNPFAAFEDEAAHGKAPDTQNSHTVANCSSEVSIFMAMNALSALWDLLDLHT